MRHASTRQGSNPRERRRNEGLSITASFMGGPTRTWLWWVSAPKTPPSSCRLRPGGPEKNRHDPYIVGTVDTALLLHFVLPVFQQPRIELWKPRSGVIELQTIEDD